MTESKKNTPKKNKSSNPVPAGIDTVEIDGRPYPVSALSPEAKSQLNNLRATDRVIQELELELSIAQTAKAAYSENMKKALLKMAEDNKKNSLQ